MRGGPLGRSVEPRGQEVGKKLTTFNFLDLIWRQNPLGIEGKATAAESRQNPGNGMTTEEVVREAPAAAAASGTGSFEIDGEIFFKRLQRLVSTWQVS